MLAKVPSKIRWRFGDSVGCGGKSVWQLSNNDNRIRRAITSARYSMVIDE